MHMNLRKSLLPSKHKLHERNTKAFLTKFPILGWCSTWIMGETKCCWWVQQQLIGISISLDFHHHVNTVIALVRPKGCNGVCSRDQPRVRQHYEHRWFWFDLTIAHTQIKVDKTIGPVTDYRDQSMKISSFFNTHTKRYPLSWTKSDKLPSSNSPSWCLAYPTSSGVFNTDSWRRSGL